MQFEKFTTKSLTLRKLTPEVCKYVFSSSDDFIKNFFAIESQDDLIIEKAKYNGGLYMHNKSFLNFQLIDIITGDFIGACGFHTWYTAHRRAEIGYAINKPAYLRKGLMSEGMTFVINYG